MTPAEYIAAMNAAIALIQILQKQQVAGQIPPADQQAMLDKVDAVRAGLTAPLEPFERIEPPEEIPVAADGMPRVIINTVPTPP
jgi:hypothetical protein